MLDILKQIRVLRYRRDKRHEVRFPGTIVTNDQDSFVVLRRLELELRNDDAGKLIRHVIRDDIGTHQMPGRVFLVRIA